MANQLVQKMLCQECGGEVVLVFVTDPVNRLVSVMHDGCDKPTVTLICDNPRKLGVITGET